MATRYSRLLPFLLLFGIILVGFGLRVWGVGFDLPHLSHPDEHHEVHRALRLGVGNFELERIAKGGYFYLLFAEFGVFFVLGKVAGLFSSADDFMIKFFQDPTYLWLIGRTTTAIIGALNIWLVFIIGNKLAGKACGIVAAALLAVSSINVLHAHYITVDVPMTFCVIVTVFFALDVAETGRLRSYLLAAVFSALAVMTKLAAAPVVAVVVLAHIMYARTVSGTPRRSLVKKLVLYLAVFLGVYVAGNPGAIILGSDSIGMVKTHLRLQPVREKAQSEVVPAENDAGIQLVAAEGKETVRVERSGVGVIEVEERPTQWSYYGRVSKETLGWPLLVLMVISVGFAAYRHRKQDILLLSFPVLLFTAISVSGSSLHNPRYLLPALPFLFIVVAEFVTAMADQLRFGPAVKTASVAVLLAVVCAPQVGAIVEQNIAFTEPGNPIACRDWVEANLPQGARVLIEGHAGASWERPSCPIQDQAENIEAYAAEIEDQSPMGALYARTKASVQQGKTFDLSIVYHWQDWPEWEDVKAGEIEYLVVSPNSLAGGSGLRTDEANRSRLEFYDSIAVAPEVQLVREIAAIESYDDHATRRAWGVQIYRILREDPGLDDKSPPGG